MKVRVSFDSGIQEEYNISKEKGPALIKQYCRTRKEPENSELRMYPMGDGVVDLWATIGIKFLANPIEEIKS